MLSSPLTQTHGNVLMGTGQGTEKAPGKEVVVLSLPTAGCSSREAPHLLTSLQRIPRACHVLPTPHVWMPSFRTELGPASRHTT